MYSPTIGTTIPLSLFYVTAFINTTVTHKKNFVLIFLVRYESRQRYFGKTSLGVRRHLRRYLPGIDSRSRIDAGKRARKRDDARPLVPVITFVLYFGLEKPWEKAKSIYELIEVPGALEEFIPDFRAKVIDLGALEDETIESFQSDMKEIVKFIKLSRQGKKEFTFKGMLNHSI